MNPRTLRPGTAVLVSLFGLVTGCRDDGTKPTESPPLEPVINAVTADAMVVTSGGEINIAVEASDPEGDSLSFVWSASGGSLVPQGASASWTAPETEGSYSIGIEVRDDEGGSARDSLALGVLNGTLLVSSSRSGVTAFRFDRTRFEFSPAHPYGIEVLGTRIFTWHYCYVAEYDRDGAWLSNSLPDEDGTCAYRFAILSDGGWASLNNEVDSVFIMAPDGAVRARVGVPNPSPGQLQNMSGMVVDDRLVVSENGNSEIFSVDVATYETSILHSFTGPGYHILGAFTFSDDLFYASEVTDGEHRISTFALSGGEADTLCILPEGNITEIISVGAHLFATVNFGNGVYVIDRVSGRFMKFLEDVIDPSDLIYLPLALEDPGES